MSTVNILAWDVETLPMVAPLWGLFKQNIRQESIVENTALFCACWQTVDQNGDAKSAVQSVSILDDEKRFKRNIYDDEHVVRSLHKALTEADIFLYQNGDKFDLRKFNARAAYYGLDPVPQKQTIDTLKRARQVFALDSNKLDFMGRYFGVGEKMETGGQQLWDNIIQCKYPPVGKKADIELTRKTIKYAVKYCKQDVLLTVKVFKKIRQYIKLPNFSLYLGKIGCNHCGGQNYRFKQWRYNQTTKKARYWCYSCKKPFDPPAAVAKLMEMAA